jgi:hypothetical protein
MSLYPPDLRGAILLDSAHPLLSFSLDENTTAEILPCVLLETRNAPGILRGEASAPSERFQVQIPVDQRQEQDLKLVDREPPDAWIVKRLGAGVVPV